MNAFPVLKSFTAVLIFLVSASVWGQAKVPDPVKNQPNGWPPYPSKTDDQEQREQCQTAVDKWRAASINGTKACGAFDGTGAKSCLDRIKNCKAKMTGLFLPDENNTDKGVQMLEQLILTKYAAPKSNPTDGPSCVTEFDRNEKRTAENEIKTERKELDREIKKEFDEQAKLLEKQREKKNEIDEKINKLEKENKKILAEKEVKIREQIATLSKSSVDIGKRLRVMNASITQDNQKIARLRLSQQTALLDLTSEKANLRCKNQLMSLKNGILKSDSGDPKAIEVNQRLKALADQFKNQGTRGTSELKALLEQTKKECFESENSKKQQQALQFNQELSTLTDHITETQNEINDEKKKLALDQENIKKIQEESEKDKTIEENAKMKEVDNLNQQMIDFQKSTEEKGKISTAHAVKLNTELENLKLKQLDVKPAYESAVSAITDADEALEVASSSCQCTSELESGEKPKASKKTEVTLEAKEAAKATYYRGICSMLRTKRVDSITKDITTKAAQ